MPFIAPLHNARRSLSRQVRRHIPVVALSGGETIDERHLPREITVTEEANGNKAKAARLLDVSERTLWCNL